MKTTDNQQPEQQADLDRAQEAADRLAAIARGESVETETHAAVGRETPVLETDRFNFYYGNSRALYDITMKIAEGKITAIIGPSGCGKSTLLRSINRLNDLLADIHYSGDILLNGDSIYGKGVDVIELRKRMGMVFQKSNPFPMSIYENVVYPLRVDGERRKQVLDEVVERSLQSAALWDEVKDRLQQNALGLSGGQQQRLCIARAIAIEPDVLLMDEPCSAIDPIATAKIEELIEALKVKYTIVLVTHNMQQAARVSDFTAFFYQGHIVEFGGTKQIFTNPKEKQTEDYITGRFG